MAGKATLRYEDSLKADEVEEWIARIFLRPVAFRIVAFLYETRIHPVHVTFCFLLVGILAAVCIVEGSYVSLIAAAICIQVKSILDAVDGQLARARKAPSRVGRFFDSAADFTVNFLLIMACAFLLAGRSGEKAYWYLGIAVFFCSEIQNSFWVYYNVFYRTVVRGKGKSVIEESRDETVFPYDENKRLILSFLKRFYRIAYGWQDRVIALMDREAKKIAGISGKDARCWYTDVRFLRWSGLLGLGTHLFAMSIALVLDEPSYYFVFVLTAANALVIVLLGSHILHSLRLGSRAQRE